MQNTHTHLRFCCVAAAGVSENTELENMHKSTFWRSTCSRVFHLLYALNINRQNPPTNIRTHSSGLTFVVHLYVRDPVRFSPCIQNFNHAVEFPKRALWISKKRINQSAWLHVQRILKFRLTQLTHFTESAKKEKPFSFTLFGQSLLCSREHSNQHKHTVQKNFMLGNDRQYKAKTINRRK